MISRVAIYPRVSTQHAQQEMSLDDQQRTLRALAERKGWEVMAVYVEQHSAWRSGRVQFEAMMSAARRHEFDAILVTNRDRWARNLRDSVNAEHELTSLGIQVHDERTAAVAGMVDYDDPDEWAQRGYADVGAERFSRMQSKRVRAGIQHKALRGLHVGDVPFGYRRPDARAPMVPDPTEAAIVHELFTRAASGLHSLTEQSRWLNRTGLAPHSKAGRTVFTKSSVAVLLANPVYLGAIVYGGASMPGLHEPIVSRALFAAVQARRTTIWKPRPKNENVYLVSGIARHSECSAPLWALGARTKGSALYYRCGNRELGNEPRCVRTTAKRDLVDREVSDLFAAIELPDSWQEWVAEEYEQPVPTDVRPHIEARLQRLQRGLADGLLPYDTAAAEIRALRAELASLEAPSEPSEAGELLLSIHEAWPVMNPLEKRETVHLVLDRITIDLRGPSITGLVPKPEYEPLFAAVSAAAGAVRMVPPAGPGHPLPNRLYAPRWTRRAA